MKRVVEVLPLVPVTPTWTSSFSHAGGVGSGVRPAMARELGRRASVTRGSEGQVLDARDQITRPGGHAIDHLIPPVLRHARQRCGARVEEGRVVADDAN